MSKWRKVKFLDLFALPSRNGLTKPSRVRGSGYKMINMGELFSNGRIYDIPMELVPLNDKEKEVAKVERYDLLFARQSLVLEGAGKCSIVMDVSDLTTFESHLIRVRLDYNIANPLFYYYYFSSSLSPISSIVSQCAQAGIKGSDLVQIMVDFPPLHIQHHIATILSRYDSLIENYQKQIKLLEEAAQRLYKEWFIDLRFPGHENTKIVGGVPEGWTPSQLGQLVEFKRGKTITKKNVIDGDIPVVAGGLGPAYYCNKSNTAKRVITVSGSGANAGFTKIYFEKVWASDCSFVDSSTTPFLHFVYCFLKDNKTTIDNLQKGAAQPHVYAKDINSLSMCIPIESVLKSFEGTASMYFDTISSFQSQIHLLTEARDRLLPKLMSGEINV